MVSDQTVYIQLYGISRYKGLIELVPTCLLYLELTVQAKKTQELVPVIFFLNLDITKYAPYKCIQITLKQPVTLSINNILNQSLGPLLSLHVVLSNSEYPIRRIQILNYPNYKCQFKPDVVLYHVCVYFMLETLPRALRF